MIRFHQAVSKTKYQSLPNGIVAIFAVNMLFCSQLATAQTKAHYINEIAHSTELDNENIKLAKQVTDRWRDWVANKPEALKEGEMSFPKIHGDDGIEGLAKQLQMTQLIVDPGRALDGEFSQATASMVLRQQIALGNLDAADQILERYFPAFSNLSLLSDVANHAANEGRPELLDWVDEKLAGVSEPVSEQDRLMLGIQWDQTKVKFIATAARLELLRSKDVGRHAILIEETVNQLQDLAKQMGDDFRSAGAQPNAFQLARFEAWSNGKSEASSQAVQAAIEKHASLSPLAAIAEEYSWTNEEKKAAEALNLVPAWVARQIYRGRHELAIAFVVQQDLPLLTRIGLLSQISTDLAASDKNLAVQSAQVARTLMNEALDCDLNDKHWQVLESVSNLAIAFQAIGDARSASELLKKAAEFWSARDDEDNSTRSLQAQHSFALLALLEAVAVTDLETKELDPDLQKLLETCLVRGYSQVDWKFDLDRQHVRQYWANGFPRTIDITKFHSGVTLAAHQASCPEYYRWLGMKFWPQAIQAFRSAKLYGSQKDQAPQLDLRVKKLMFGQVIHASLKHHGLKGTLEWTKEVEEPSVRMFLELDAIEKTFLRQATLPRWSPNSIKAIVPFSLVWTGC